MYKVVEKCKTSLGIIKICQIITKAVVFYLNKITHIQNRLC